MYIYICVCMYIVNEKIVIKTLSLNQGRTEILAHKNNSQE